MFNTAQLEIIKEINKVVTISATVQAFFINLFEVLHQDCDLEKLKTSKRFPLESKWKGGETHKYERSSIYDYLINDSRIEQLRTYVNDNQTRIIDAFKDFAPIKSITEYIGTPRRIFKTTNGHLYVATNCERIGEVDEFENVLYVNVKTGKPVIGDQIVLSDKKKRIMDMIRSINEQLKSLTSLVMDMDD